MSEKDETDSDIEPDIDIKVEAQPEPAAETEPERSEPVLNESDLEESEVDSNESSGSCGALLAAARRSKGLTVPEVAARLCLSISRIEALETDNYASLPEATFTRGYIKSYAQLVELEPDHVLSFIPKSPSTRENSPKMVIVPAEPLAKESSGGPKIFIILASLAMIAYIVWYLQQQPSTTVIPAASSTIQSESTQSAISVSNETATTATSGTISIAAGESSSDSNPINLDSEVAEDSTTTIASEVTPPASVFTSPTNGSEDGAFKFGASNLRVSCSSAVWLDIRDNTGEKLFYRTCTSGEEVVFSINLPAAVFAGSVSGIELILDNRAVDLASYSNGLSYARFTLNDWSTNVAQPSALPAQ